jgi:hypothetical protein
MTEKDYQRGEFSFRKGREEGFGLRSPYNYGLISNTNALIHDTNNETIPNFQIQTIQNFLIIGESELIWDLEFGVWNLEFHDLSSFDGPAGLGPGCRPGP